MIREFTCLRYSVQNWILRRHSISRDLGRGCYLYSICEQDKQNPLLHKKSFIIEDFHYGNCISTIKSGTSLKNMHMWTHSHIHAYIYIYIFGCNEITPKIAAKKHV